MWVRFLPTFIENLYMYPKRKSNISKQSKHTHHSKQLKIVRKFVMICHRITGYLLLHLSYSRIYCDNFTKTFSKNYQPWWATNVRLLVCKFEYIQAQDWERSRDIREVTSMKCEPLAVRWADTRYQPTPPHTGCPSAADDRGCYATPLAPTHHNTLRGSTEVKVRIDNREHTTKLLSL